MPLTLDIGVVCDIGGGDTQKGNEDTSVILLPANLFGAIDGMGGPGNGRLAARTVANAFKGLTYIEEPDQGILHDIVCSANAQVYEVNQTKRLKRGHRMGAVGTFAWVDIQTGTTLIAHVGDSRGYLYRLNSLQAITADQTPLAGMDEEARKLDPRKNIVNSAFGLRKEVPVDYYQLTLGPGDTLLLCSDGLSDFVPSTSLMSILSRNRPASDIAKSLLRAAILHHTYDNVTAVVVRVLGDQSPASSGQTICPA